MNLSLPKLFNMKEYPCSSKSGSLSSFRPHTSDFTKSPRITKFPYSIPTVGEGPVTRTSTESLVRTLDSVEIKVRDEVPFVSTYKK